MSVSDRDSNYMKSMWGTTKLVTDYTEDLRVLQEVMYDPAKKSKSSKLELFEESDESDENDFEYGIEPTYKLNKGQRML